MAAHVEPMGNSHTRSLRQEQAAADQSRYVVINADDLGICREVNVAVVEGHQHGVLTSASLMSNGVAFNHALENVIGPHPELGVGVHLCLTSGLSVLPAGQLPGLVDAVGRFRHGFASLFRGLRSRPKEFVRQVEAELDAQFARIAGAGVQIDHVDSHRYVHMIPAVFDIALKLADRYGCGWIRIPQERTSTLTTWCGALSVLNRARNLPKQQLLAALSRFSTSRLNGLQKADHYHGLFDSGAVTPHVLIHLLGAVGAGVTEIATHPGASLEMRIENCHPGDRRFLSSPNRRRELAALCEPRVVDLCRLNLLQLTHFRELARRGHSWSDEPARAVRSPSCAAS